MSPQPGAGDLRYPVAIESPTSIKNNLGEDVRSWVLLANVWAAMLPLRGREFFAAGERQSETTMRIVIRYRSDVTTAHRITYAGKHYNIQAVINTDGRNRWLELMCSEGLVDG